jgi:PHD/YefM family antitoxin component YafN of YafNO toxin-antitoxin module
MRTIRVPQDFVPADRFAKEAGDWVEWIEAAGRPVVITRRGKAVAVLVAPDDYLGASDSLEVLRGLAGEMQGSLVNPSGGAGRSGAARAASAREPWARKTGRPARKGQTRRKTRR